VGELEGCGLEILDSVKFEPVAGAKKQVALTQGDNGPVKPRLMMQSHFQYSF